MMAKNPRFRVNNWGHSTQSHRALQHRKGVRKKQTNKQLTIFLVVGHQHEDGMMDIHWFMGIKSQNSLNKLIEEKMYRIPSNVAVEIMISRYFRYSTLW